MPQHVLSGDDSPYARTVRVETEAPTVVIVDAAGRPVLLNEHATHLVEATTDDPLIVHLVEPVVVGNPGGSGGTGLLLEGDLGVRVASLINGVVPLTQLPAQALPKLAHVHVQANPSTVWVIEHGLAFDPAAVEVVDHNGTQHYPQVIHLSPLLVQLRFGRDVRGTARLS